MSPLEFSRGWQRWYPDRGCTSSAVTACWPRTPSCARWWSHNSPGRRPSASEPRASPRGATELGQAAQARVRSRPGARVGRTRVGFSGPREGGPIAWLTSDSAAMSDALQRTCRRHSTGQPTASTGSVGVGCPCTGSLAEEIGRSNLLSPFTGSLGEEKRCLNPPIPRHD